MTDKARVAIVGTGWWATTAHFPSLLRHPDAEIVAVADARPDRLAKAAEAYGIHNQYTDVEEMLDKERLDGAVVSTWHAAHYEVARACLERGLHVMIEKPMVLEATHARHLVELAESQGREIIVGYPWHFQSRGLRAREVLQSGELGEIRYVNCYFTSFILNFVRGDDRSYEAVFDYPVHGPGDVYSDPKRSGGGEGHLQITHSAGLMYFITGLRPVSVMALMDNLGLNLDLIDAMTVRMDNGALANVGGAGNLPMGDPGKLSIQVNCDYGWLDINFVSGAGRIRHADGTDEHLAPLAGGNQSAGAEGGEEAYPLFATAGNLVDVITGKAANGSPGEVGWRVVEMLDAAYRSAAQGGRAVSVESLYE